MAITYSHRRIPVKTNVESILSTHLCFMPELIPAKPRKVRKRRKTYAERITLRTFSFQS